MYVQNGIISRVSAVLMRFFVPALVIRVFCTLWTYVISLLTNKYEGKTQVSKTSSYESVCGTARSEDKSEKQEQPLKSPNAKNRRKRSLPQDTNGTAKRSTDCPRKIARHLEQNVEKFQRSLAANSGAASSNTCECAAQHTLTPTFMEKLLESARSFQGLLLQFLSSSLTRIAGVFDTASLTALEDKLADVILQHNFENVRSVIYGMYTNYEDKKVTIDVIDDDISGLKRALANELPSTEFGMLQFARVKLNDLAQEDPPSMDLDEFRPIDRGFAVWVVEDEHTKVVDKSGSFGFLAHDKNDPTKWYVVTTAHTVLPKEYNCKGIIQAMETHQNAKFDFERDIFCDRRPHRNGRLIGKWLYALLGSFPVTLNENGRSSDVHSEIDIAVLPVEDRAKDEFTEMLTNTDGDPVHVSWDYSQLQEKINANQCDIEKMGHVTGQTFGRLLNIKYRELRHQNTWSVKLLLGNSPANAGLSTQPDAVLRGRHGNIFAKKGDSGALILHSLGSSENQNAYIPIGLLWKKKENMATGRVEYIATRLNDCLEVVRERFDLDLEFHA